MSTRAGVAPLAFNSTLRLMDMHVRLEMLVASLRRMAMYLRVAAERRR